LAGRSAPFISGIITSAGAAENGRQVNLAPGKDNEEKAWREYHRLTAARADKQEQIERAAGRPGYAPGRAGARVIASTTARMAPARGAPLQPAENVIDDPVDELIREWGVVVGHEEPVVDRPVQRVEHDVGVQALAQFPAFDPAAHELAGDPTAGLHPARLDRLPQVRVHLRPPNQGPQERPRLPQLEVTNCDLKSANSCNDN
jgi:hypothetical protein